MMHSKKGLDPDVGHSVEDLTGQEIRRIKGYEFPLSE